MRSIFLAVVAALIPVSVAAETVHLYAAGSLKAVMADITRAFEAKSGGAVKVETVLGPSGILRERIEKGEAAHVFASADTGHPKRLGDQGRTAGPLVVFAHNELCALARGGLAVAADTLLNACSIRRSSSARRRRKLTHRVTMHSRCSARRRLSKPVPRRHWKPRR
jgi:ABC-type molybdate transport system substrate-binding protein